MVAQGCKRALSKFEYLTQPIFDGFEIANRQGSHKTVQAFLCDRANLVHNRDRSPARASDRHQ